MKKIIYWILILLSIFMLIGGIGSILDNGVDILDFIMILFFACIIIFCIFKLKKSRHSKIKKNNTLDEFKVLQNENRHLKEERNNVKKELNIKNKQLESEEIKQSKKNEEEKVIEFESEETRKNIEMLNMKLKLKEDYIKQLEENQNINEQSHHSEVKNDNFHFVIKENTTQTDTPLDLNYTKARKIINDFVVLDFETTGLKYNEHEIIQYGVVEFKNGIIINEYSQYFRPDKPVGKTVMRKTGITNDFLEDKPKISESYMEKLSMLLSGKTIVAHNAPFDMKFLLKNLQDFNIEHEKFRVFDTLTASRRLINETPNHKLETLKEYFNLDDGESHQALNDAKATGQLALLLIDRME